MASTWLEAWFRAQERAEAFEADTNLERTGGGFDGEGMRVVMEPIPGITPRGIMGTDGFFFQCPPLEEFAPEYGHTHTDYDTVKRGQFSRKGGRLLRTVSFDTLFVDQGSFSILREPIHIEDFTERLIDISEQGDPFLLTVSHAMPPHGYDNWEFTLAGPELQMEATLRTVKVSEKAGEGDARYVNVAFTEYREPFAERATRKHRRRPKREDWPRTVWLNFTGVARDKQTNRTLADPPLKPLTLHRLARHFYHDATLWQHIAGHRKNQILNWGADDQLLDYFEQVRGQQTWPVVITVPKPPTTAVLTDLEITPDLGS